MSSSSTFPAQASAQRQFSLIRQFFKMTFLMLLLAALTTITLWLGSERVYSASSGVATPPPPPAPMVTIDVPDEILIGEDFQFEVTFDNITGAGVGYGPYIELYLPAKGADSNSPDSNLINQKCDGISFLSAGTSFANPPTVALPPTYDSFLSTSASNFDCAKLYTLPFVGMTPPAPQPGDYQLVVIELPFGSFDQSQPEVVINVKAHLSDFADEGTPLTIYARGGFRFGSNALNDHPADPLLETTLVSDQTIPRVLKLKKAYLGPEDEAVSGPNFINVYPLKYQVTADIANQQTIHNLVIADILPNNLQFAGNVQVTINGNNAIPVTSCATNPGPNDVVISTPSTSLSPGGSVNVQMCSSIIGSTTPDEVLITFDFFIPEKDAGKQDILAINCKDSPVLVKNDILAKGDWDPLDPRDPTPNSLAGTTVPVKSNLTNVDHVLQAKCLAIQKTVAQRPPNTGGPGLTPGDTLRYELNFQISDYRTMGKILITDLLSDGQLLVGTPTLTVVGDQFGSYSNISFNSTTFSATADKNITCPNPGGIKGGTIITFRVASALAAAAASSGGHPRHLNGLLTGGHAAGPPSSVPAKGQIVFYAQIQDEFLHQPSARRFVDKYDPLNNCVSIDGLVFQNEVQPTVPSSTLGNTTDGSGTQVRIAMEKPKKTVYAVKQGSSFVCGPSTTACLNLPGTPQDVHPGDEVTFRIEYSIPSGDAESLKVEDWLPLPIFDVASTAWSPGVPNCTTPPPAGMACRLAPGHTLTPPSLASGTANNLVFTYGTFDNPANTPKNIDLLFTLTATNKPFADGLFLTNEARENENNTFGPVPPQVTIAQVNLREPKLAIRKGVIATDNPYGEFSQPIPSASPTPAIATAQAPAGVTFSLAGFTGAITSTNLGTLLNSNLSNVDANDWVTFAIVVENQGGHPAYDVKLKDAIPSCLTNITAISAKWGTGVPLPLASYTITPPSPDFTFSLNPSASIPANGATANGANIIVITFRAQLPSKISPGCCDNVAELQQYASQPGGPNFVTAGFTPPFKDPAQVCVKPKAEKCVTATSEVHTQADNSVSGIPQPPQVAVGEIIRYHLTMTLPEGVSPFFKVTDFLPAGLTYMPGTAKVAFVSTLGINAPAVSGAGMSDPGLTYTLGCLKPNPTVVIPSGLVTPALFTSGVDPTFSLGTLTNIDNDSNLEYVIIEFNALVNNIPTNVDAVTLKNNYEIFLGKVVAGQIPVAIATSNDSDVKIVEPNLTITKTVAPNPAFKGQTLTYTVQFTNNGTADAFDVVLKDALPPGLTLGTITAGCPFTSGGNVITVNCAQVPKAPSPGSTVIVNYQALANPATCPVTLPNQANLTWTSLPGPKGTLVNQTGSSTPGNPGLVDGERDGVTVPLTLNDYAASASASVKIDCPCCLQVSNETLSCNANGSFNYTFTLTNLSGATVSAVSFFPSAGVTITPSSTAIPPLASGASTTVTVTIGGTAAVSGATVCFGVGLGGPATPGCRIQHCVTLPACQSGCATPPPNMVSWWPLDETSGNTVVDIKGGHNGTTSANIGSGPTSAIPPKVGNALFFGNSKATVAGGFYNFGTGNFSIDAWVKGSGSNAALGIVDKLDTTSAIPTGFSFFIRSGTVRLIMGNGTPSGATFIGTTPFTHNAWQHVAVTVQRVGVGSPIGRFYLNGVPAGTFVPPPQSVNNGASLLIGSHRLNLGGCGSCEVSLDEIEIFSEVVSPNAIKSIFQADKNGKCKATINGLKFNDLNGNGVRDSGEPGLPGWTITITGSSSNTQTTITDALGNYSFTVPAPDTYTVAEIQQSGWTQTAPTSGTYSVAVTPAQVISRNFGNKKSANQCELNIEKKMAPNPLVSGQQATATITVKNVGTAPCHGPTKVVESNIPGLTLITASVLSGTCVLSTGVCTYPPGIPAGGTVVFTYVFQVNAQPGALMENCARLLPTEDTDPTNNSVCIPLQVIKPGPSSEKATHHIQTNPPLGAVRSQ